MGKKQHYIPVFYLKGFIDTNKDCLWVYEKGKHRPSSPDAEGFQNYFYSFKDIYGQRNAELLEDAFRKREDAAAPVFQKIKSFASSFSYKELESFAAFTALMITRVPSFREFVDKLAAKYSKDTMKELASNPESFEEFLSKVRNETGKDYGSVDDLRQYLLTDQYEIIQTNPDFALQFIAYAKGVESVLLRMNWQFIEAPPMTKFLTSDNPVYKQGQRIDDAIGEVIFPVSSEYCFRGHWKNQAGRVMYMKAPDRDVKQVNWMVTSIAKRFVYGSEGTDSIQEFVDKYVGTITLSIDKNVPNIKIPEFL